MELSGYPNPAGDNVFVQLTSTIGVPYSIELFDINGRVIISQTHKASDSYLVNEISINDLPSGIYYVKAVRLSDGESVREKLIVK